MPPMSGATVDGATGGVANGERNEKDDVTFVGTTVSALPLLLVVGAACRNEKDVGGGSASVVAPPEVASRGAIAPPPPDMKSKAEEA